MKRLSIQTDADLIRLRERCWAEIERTLVRPGDHRAATTGLWLNVALSVTAVLLCLIVALATPYPRTPYGPPNTEKFRGIPF
jgi:hypothetical protein